MIFDRIRGNSDVVKALVDMVDSGRIPHALMLYENDGCGAMLFALAFLERLMGSQKVHKLIHPDIHFVFPVTKGNKVKTDKPTSELYLQYWRELLLRHPYFLESDLDEALGIVGKSSVIAVAEAHKIIDRLSIGALEGGYRAVLIYLPEKMNGETANKLLKFIEEPPASTQFVLVTHAPEGVLPTISSRCMGIRIGPMLREEIQDVLVAEYAADSEQARSAAETAGGSVGRAVLAMAQDGEQGSEAELFCDLMKALISKNLSESLDLGDKIASLPSREKAKSFCRFCGEAFRKILMIQQGLPQISGAASGEMAVYEEFASRLRPGFVRRALPYLDDTVAMINRNVSQKILFCDLVNRLYMMV